MVWFEFLWHEAYRAVLLVIFCGLTKLFHFALIVGDIVATTVMMGIVDMPSIRCGLNIPRHLIFPYDI